MQEIVAILERRPLVWIDVRYVRVPADVMCGYREGGILSNIALLICFPVIFCRKDA